MSRFFVGQRVRIIGSYPPYSMVGMECRIVGWKDSAWNHHESRWYSGWLLDAKNSRGFAYAAEEWQLEPITPPHVAGSWEIIEQLLPDIREGVGA